MYYTLPHSEQEANVALVDVPVEVALQRLDYCEKLIKKGEKIRTYAIWKFVEVTSDQGEYLYGYDDWMGNIFYFRGAFMINVSTHHDPCDCMM